jgi:polyisoprenoid-binding protein YceI
MSKLVKRILIAGVLLAIATVVVIFAIPWGEYESTLEKTDLQEAIEYDSSEDAESNQPPSLEELQGNSYTITAGENVPAEIIFDVEGLKKTKGGFTEFTITFDVPEDFKQAALMVDIKTASINTGNTMRDEHLVEEDYFHAEKYPSITYISNEVIMGDTSYVALGELTMNGTTGPLEVPFLHLGKGEYDDGETFEAFQGYLEIDRTKFGQEEETGIGNIVKTNFYCELKLK